MKKSILMIGIVMILIVINGCKSNPLLISKCPEAKEEALELVSQIDESNIQYSFNSTYLSYKSWIETYNRLCSDITGEI